MENAPLVSVVIPSYKRSDTVKSALDSVLNQTYQNLEIWLVDDNGEDKSSTESLLKAIEEISKDKRFNYFKPEKHINGSFARNEGIKKARGEYIAFLDDDDIWYPSKLEKQIRKFQEDSDVGLVYCGAKSVFPKENLSYEIKPTKKGDMSKEAIMGNFIATSSVAVVRKNVLDKAGLFDITLPARQDYELWLRISQVSKVDYVDEILVEYMNERGSNQVTSSVDKYETACRILEEKYEKIISKLSPKQRRTRKERELWNLANRALRNGNKKGAQLYASQMAQNKMYKRAIMTYLFSYMDYKTVIKLRSKRGKGFN